MWMVNLIRSNRCAAEFGRLSRHHTLKPALSFHGSEKGGIRGEHLHRAAPAARPELSSRSKPEQTTATSHPASIQTQENTPQPRTHSRPFQAGFFVPKSKPEKRVLLKILDLHPLRATAERSGHLNEGPKKTSVNGVSYHRRSDAAQCAEALSHVFQELHARSLS